MLQLQAQDLEQRKAELALKSQELAQAERDNERTHQYALRALEVKEKESGSHVQVFSKMVRWKYGLIGLSILAVAALIVLFTLSGHPELVEKTFTHGTALLGGGGIGYAVRARKAEKDAQSKQAEDE